MMMQQTSYDVLAGSHQWQIPDYYNIGVDVCDKWADREPQRLALIHIEKDGSLREFTFGDVRRLSNQTANMLLSQDVTRGDRVGVLLPQAPETGYSHVAIYKIGGVAIPLSTLFGTEALRYRLGNSQTKAVITNAAGARKLAEVRPMLPHLRAVFCVEPTTDDCLDFHAIRDAQTDDFSPVRTMADDPALIIYTSGTTGQPKGALHAHRVLLGHLPGVEVSHNLLPRDGDRLWTPADWAWIGGLYDVLMPGWHHGITVVSHRFEKFDPEAAFQLISDLRVRNAFLPPTALKMMRGVRGANRRWRLDMRTIASGGETLGAELIDWGLETFGLTVNEFYGQTECNMIVSNCSEIMPVKRGSMGRPVPGHHLAILGTDGQPVSTNQLGEIAIMRPDPVMFVEYWGDRPSTTDKFAGEWLLTGDMGVMDDDGYIRFLGRTDDIINSAGYRIGPGEIEDCLLGHPAVKTAAVIGVPDAMRDQIVKAYIVLSDGYQPDPALIADIKEHVKARLSAHEYPRVLAFVAELPLTTTGKTVRRTLREWHERGIA